jgi:RNA polymerase sigma-70 factor, ECF subfamily
MPPQLDVTVAPESKAVVSRVDRDRALVEARRRREPSAADDLLATYGDRACRLATRLTGNPQDAEEVVQDAFWCVIRQIDTFRRESAFGSWLYRIVANAAYQKLRRRAVRRRELSLDEMLPAFDHRGKHVEPVPDWSASVDDPARQTELRAALSAAIEELPPDYRAVVVLRDVEGLAHCEIGDALGLTIGSVKTRVHRARLFLRQRLERHLSPS